MQRPCQFGDTQGTECFALVVAAFAVEQPSDPAVLTPCGPNPWTDRQRF